MRVSWPTKTHTFTRPLVLKCAVASPTTPEQVSILRVTIRPASSSDINSTANQVNTHAVYQGLVHSIKTVADKFPPSISPELSLYAQLSSSSVSDTDMNYTTNQHSHRLLRKSLMLFLHALLFFLLCTLNLGIPVSPTSGVKAAAVKSEPVNWLNGYWTSPVVSEYGSFISSLAYLYSVRIGM